MKKHILFILENNPFPYDIRVINEAEAAKAFGYDVTVISPVCSISPSKYENIKGIDVFRHYIPAEAEGKKSFLKEYACALFHEFILALRVYIKKPFHYIHSANPPDHVFLIAIFFKLLGVKYIFDHHDISPENYLAKFGRKDALFKILKLMEKATFKCADLVISTNESYKKIAVGRGGKQSRDVFVVRNGPVLDKVIYMKPNPALKNGCDFLVVYVGVIGNQEGLDNLLKAVEYIVYTRGIKNIRFMIIGKGPELSTLKEMAKKMKIEKYAIFTGFIPYREFYEILATADVCVNPEHRNPFTDKSTMLKIMDYMVVAKPIVQFETAEGRVTAGEASVYVRNNDNNEFADEILRLLDDPEKRKLMGEIGKRRINDLLNWDLQKQALKNAYAYLEVKC